MTEQILIDINGADHVASMLADAPEVISKRYIPHNEAAPPIPTGIHPAFPDENTPSLPPDAAMLAGMFAMPAAEN